MIPSIGRLVHYIIPSGLNQGQRRAALIVDIADGEPTEKSAVTLLVFNAPGDARGHVSFQPDIFQDPAGKAVGTWHAPQQQAQPAVDQDAADLVLLDRLEAAAKRRHDASNPRRKKGQQAEDQQAEDQQTPAEGAQSKGDAGAATETPKA